MNNHGPVVPQEATKAVWNLLQNDSGEGRSIEDAEELLRAALATGALVPAGREERLREAVEDAFQAWSDHATVIGSRVPGNSHRSAERVKAAMGEVRAIFGGVDR